MDELPFELLVSIAESISLEPRPQLRQASLASLCRANKLFYAATQPVLYRNPVLLSQWRAKIYEKTIAKTVDPWTLSSQRKREEKRPWMPKTLDFNFPIPPQILNPYSIAEDFWRDTRFSIPNFAVSSMGGPFDNLTSLSFVNCRGIDQILSALLGPGRQVRHKIRRLEYLGSIPVSSFLFLLDASHYSDATWFLSEWRKVGVDYPEEEEETSDQASWERPTGGQSDKGAWATVKPKRETIERARFAFDVFVELVDLGLLYERDFLNPTSFIHSRPPSRFPFSSLSSLTLTIDDDFQHYLIFYTTSFPALRRLKLGPALVFILCADSDRATFRYSVTRRQGVIRSNEFIIDEAEKLEPLSQTEQDAYPLKPYRGPDLEQLEFASFD